MRKYNYLLPVSLFFAVVCMGTQCHKDEMEYQHQFLERINMYPAQKVYHIGDTIWLTYSNSDKKLFDVKINQQVPVDSLLLPFDISYQAAYNTPVNPAGGFCTFVLPVNISSQQSHDAYNDALQLFYGCDNKYAFKVGIVAKTTGIYSLALRHNQQTVGSSCASTGVDYSLIEYRFDAVDGNMDIYSSYPKGVGYKASEDKTNEYIKEKLLYFFQVE